MRTTQAVANTTIIGFGIEEYDNLPSLMGVSNDLSNIEILFTKDEVISIYSSSKINLYLNSTTSEIHNVITEYVSNRTARGDKLIFYFAGHGAVLGNGDFYLCAKDTKKGFDLKGFLPLSAISIREIIFTLSVADILPCFIIDACFSGTSINTERVNFGLAVEYIANKSLGNSYAILASSGSDSFSIGNNAGGYFTNSILHDYYSSKFNNLQDEYITIQNIAKPLNDILAKKGAPLSRLHIGRSYPLLNICKNINYKEKIRKESLVHSYKPIFEYILRDGDPKPFTPGELRGAFPSAYGNNKKMIYIWGLLEEVEGNSKLRKLTEKGVCFVNNEISLSKTMIKDPNTEEWTPSENTEYIFYRDL